MARIDLITIEDYVANHLKLFILSVAGLLVLVGIIAVSIFFIAVRGAEQCMVPDVRGKELTEALLELQVKELYPRILFRYSQTSKDKGFILEQDPKPGTIVKAGRRVRLVVSQGVIINKIENFIGRNIDDVKMDMQTIYVSSGGIPLLIINDPVMYDFSAETPGTILVQKPEPGTDISGPTTMEFVVSRGQENAIIMVPQLAGLEFSRALELIGSSGINFEFSIMERTENDAVKGGTVVSQLPPANTSAPANTPVQLTVAAPERLTEGEIFGLFRYTIPANPYPLAVRLEALLPSSERLRLFSVHYLGGEFTVPYRLPVGTVLILSMLNRELYRETVSRYNTM
ncbi:MAG: PASTA domain-containing protein [Treponema sp.]|jgi:beta-lactam-binding protein with PASTA domain|nr:PASTA domain-containing protein [Treponema sp.]